MAITTEFVLNYLKTEGAVHAGVATPATLKGGPPSTDLSYVMPSARSAIVFALPLVLDNIPPYLGKKDRLSFETDYIRKSSLGDGIAVKLANLLKATGSPSVPLAVNEVYREGPPEDKKLMYPDISLRYLAAASGVGFLGFSGNLLTNDYGPAVILGGLLTEAELEPTKPLDKSENYCDHYACLQCCETCPSKMLNDNMDLVTITMGGYEHQYGKKKDLMGCGFVCMGFTGLDDSGEWSTWATGRFPLPKTDEEVARVAKFHMDAFQKRPEQPGGRYHGFMPNNKIYYVCSNCQMVCVPHKEERRRRVQLIKQSGVIMQKEDGTLEAVTPEEAKIRFEAMDPEIRALYEGPVEPDTRSQEEVIEEDDIHRKVGAS
jgi:epoxyqueuosine reductase QueG